MIYLDELALRLDTYFHDGQILAFSLDLATRVATIDLRLWVDHQVTPDRPDGEALRSARLELIGVAYFVVESPDDKYPYADSGPVTIDLGEADPGRGLPPTMESHFAGRFFVSDWNSFIHFSAREATLRWAGEADA